MQVTTSSPFLVVMRTSIQSRCCFSFLNQCTAAGLRRAALSSTASSPSLVATRISIQSKCCFFFEPMHSSRPVGQRPAASVLVHVHIHVHVLVHVRDSFPVLFWGHLGEYHLGPYDFVPCCKGETIAILSGAVLGPFWGVPSWAI